MCNDVMLSSLVLVLFCHCTNLCNCLRAGWFVVSGLLCLVCCVWLVVFGLLTLLCLVLCVLFVVFGLLLVSCALVVMQCVYAVVQHLMDKNRYACIGVQGRSQPTIELWVRKSLFTSTAVCLKLGPGTDTQVYENGLSRRDQAFLQQRQSREVWRYTHV